VLKDNAKTEWNIFWHVFPFLFTRQKLNNRHGVRTPDMIEIYPLP